MRGEGWLNRGLSRLDEVGSLFFGEVMGLVRSMECSKADYSRLHCQKTSQKCARALIKGRARLKGESEQGVKGIGVSSWWLLRASRTRPAGRPKPVSAVDLTCSFPVWRRLLCSPAANRIPFTPQCAPPISRVSVPFACYIHRPSTTMFSGSVSLLSPYILPVSLHVLNSSFLGNHLPRYIPSR
jgi:hypothetical protein